MQRLSTGYFKNDFVSAFPGDESGSLLPRQTPGVLYSKANPTPVSSPSLLGWSEDLAKELDIEFPDQKDIDILAGNLITPSMSPYASCYAGHQFGSWAGQLGDGRAITLGEWENSKGEIYEMQLKGAGPTAYSRRADGRAVLRSSLREYLMSEAMHHLGIPTTRALSLVSTGEQVLRDMFYNGNAAFEPGAIVMRVAPSFLRFGNYEMLAARKDIQNLQKLANWTIERFYSHIQGEDKVIQWFKEVIERTAQLIVDWMRVGFVHGVMNTDNMSILGLTIDYGPFSFVDEYDPDFTPNTTDLPGRRYAFSKQSSVAYWNLGCLANAIAPLIKDTDQLVAEMNSYEEKLSMKYFKMMANKLGFDRLQPGDVNFIVELEEMISVIKPDMTIFFQLLMDIDEVITEEDKLVKHFENSFYHILSEEESSLLASVMIKYVSRISQNTISREDSKQIMRKNNPRFILRNYLLHQAIEKLETGDASLFEELQRAIRYPYSVQSDKFLLKRPQWANRKAGCSMLSCSS